MKGEIPHQYEEDGKTMRAQPRVADSILDATACSNPLARAGLAELQRRYGLGTGAAMRLRAMEKGLRLYLEWMGPEHDEDCPADDTCSCSWKPILDGANDACRFLGELVAKAGEAQGSHADPFCDERKA